MFNRKVQRQKRHLRLRQRVIGTAARPRMSICVTNKHMYVQFIDDDAGRTLAQANSLKDEKANLEVAKALGAKAAEAAKAAGISLVVVDRGGRKYTGRVAAIVEAAVAGGVAISAKKEEKKAMAFNRDKRQEQDDALDEHTVFINRCAKTVKGGRRMSFSAVIVVGDKEGKVGVGFGKANEVADAIRKGGEAARKDMRKVVMKGKTIPHDVEGVCDGGRVILKPAEEGTGLIVGGGMRPVLEAAGIRDAVGKSLGSKNRLNVVKATLNALSKLRSAEETAATRA